MRRWSPRPTPEAMMLQIAAGLAPDGKATWDQADEKHRNAWVAWARQPRRTRERARRLVVVVDSAQAGNLSFHDYFAGGG